MSLRSGNSVRNWSANVRSLEERNRQYTGVQRLLVDLQGEPSNVTDGTSVGVGGGTAAVATHRRALAWRGAGGAVSAGSCCVGSVQLHHKISTFVDTLQGHLQVALVVPQHQLRVRARAGRLGHHAPAAGRLSHDSDQRALTVLHRAHRVMVRGEHRHCEEIGRWVVDVQEQTGVAHVLLQDLDAQIMKIAQTNGPGQKLQRGDHLVWVGVVSNKTQKSVLLSAVGRNGGSITKQQESQVVPVVLQGQEQRRLAFQIGQIGRTASVDQPRCSSWQGLLALHDVTIARVVFTTGAEEVQGRLVQRILGGIHIVAENGRDGADGGHAQRSGIRASHCGQQIDPFVHFLF
mmetsp:Transcript_8836/g.15037  ORF Transcript_8836/g.15037 Transcript_8836/m.15037 type:complete len:347 (-) Transcript_8836:1318-2358(-)